MKTYMHSDFLNGPQKYLDAAEFWKKMFDDLLSEYPRINEWHEWFKKTYANGTPIMDGNPIFDMINMIEKKAIRIIQLPIEETTNDYHEVSSWIDYCNEGDFTIRNLVISCVLSVESEKIIRKLLQSFIILNFSDEDMESLIKSLCGAS